MLERGVERFLPQELELYFDDIVDASERIWDNLDNYKEVVEALEDTNESVISHRQNDVLRFLTVFSVVLLPLSVITGIFGMNVNFPGFGTVWAFWTIFAVMGAVLDESDAAGFGQTIALRYRASDDVEEPQRFRRYRCAGGASCGWRGGKRNGVWRFSVAWLITSSRDEACAASKTDCISFSRAGSGYAGSFCCAWSCNGRRAGRAPWLPCIRA